MALYKKVVQDLKDHIDNGALLPSQRIASIQELCQQYGVSQITIRAAIRELVTQGYLESRKRAGIFVKERRVDSSLMSGNVIAILVTAMQNPFFAEIVHAAEEEARSVGYRLIVANSANKPEIESQQVRELAGQVAGLIIAPVTGSANYAAYLTLLERNVPFVFIDRYVDKLAVPVIATDNEQGGYVATKHLIETGVKRVVIITDRGASSINERAHGYRRALRDAKIPFDPSDVIPAENSEVASAFNVMRDYLRTVKPKERFGIFATNDTMGRGVVAAVKDAGLRIPQDVGIVSFDDITALYMDPPVTAIRQRLSAIGSSAVRILIDLIRNTGSDKIKNVRLTPELIVRASSVIDHDFNLGDHLDTVYRDAKDLADETPAVAA